MRKLPPQAYLKECLDYDPITGVLTWKTRPANHFEWREHWRAWNTKWAGKRAATIQWSSTNDHRCWKISVNSERYLAVRVIWKWMTGEDPPHEVDHKNRDGTDDRWENLRLAKHAENMRNSGNRKPRALPKGVYATRNGQRWFSHIMVGRKITYLGTFDSPEEAHSAYCEAARRLHGEFADYGAHQAAPFG